MKRMSNFERICGTIMACAVAVAAQDAITSIISPTDTNVYHVGDTLRVEWTADEEFLDRGVVVEISFDGGLKWRQISPGEAMSNSARELEWVIPDTLQFYEYDPAIGEARLVKLHTVSDQVAVHVYEYDGDGLHSDVFSILPAGTHVGHRVAAARSAELLDVTRSTAGSYMVVVPVAGEHTLTLVDSRGRQVQSRTATGPAAYSLPVSHLAPGAYLMKVRTREGAAVHRLNVTR